MGCTCGYITPPPREMLALDILAQSEPRKIKWWRNWEAAFGPIGDDELGMLLAQTPAPPRRMVLGDLYAYKVFGWHQFGWPSMPTEWWY